MVFSFFKKAPEKMVAKPAAVPRPKEGTAAPGNTPAAKPTASSANVIEPAAQANSAIQDNKLTDSSVGFSDFVFSESSPDFQIEGDVDPIDAAAEEAAVLFANGQDEAARAGLEDAVRAHQSGQGERLWLMLFDLYRLLGQKAPFEALEIDFVRTFEKSPPAWRDTSVARGKSKSKEVATGSLLFRGELTGDNTKAFELIQQALDKNPKLRLDLSKVKCIDAGGCGLLLDSLQRAKKATQEIELLGRESILSLIEACVEVGVPENQECWLLLLELLQLQGQHEAFEDAAINFAVTFEVSPPSWEAKRVAQPEPEPEQQTSDQALDAEVYTLTGEIRSSRFPDLATYAEMHNPLVIGCDTLRRIDFISAGAMLNILSSVKRTGRQIVFHHPNHLVAELFGVVGLTAVAAVVFEKH
jgi:anti-anti-sigma regulatory factor